MENVFKRDARNILNKIRLQEIPILAWLTATKLTRIYNKDGVDLDGNSFCGRRRQ